MKRPLPIAGFLLLCGFPFFAAAQNVYLKDYTHQGIPCVLLGNEKIEIIVAKGITPQTPKNQYHLAPIQAIRYAGKLVSDNEPNYLEAADDFRECAKNPFTTDGLNGKDNPVQQRTFSIIRQTAGEVIIALRYRFAKAENRATRDGRGQSGYYQCTLSLRSGEPLVMVEEESDYNFSYKVETGRNLFNRARYRGRYSNSPEEGYVMANGRKEKYLNESQFPGSEATVDLNYDAPTASCAPFRHYPALAQWDIWPNGTGWYWQLYDNNGKAQSPTIGLFTGPASRLAGASCMQVNFFTQSDNRASGIRLNINRINPARYFSKWVRMQWGLYTGTQGADIVTYNTASPLLKWFNRKSGMADKLAVFEKRNVQLSPEWEWAAFYQDKDAVQQIIQKTRKEPAFAKWLSEQDVYSASLFEAWSGNACGAEKVYHAIRTRYELFKEMMVNGQGIYSYALSKKFTGSCQEKEVATDLSHYLRAADWFRRDALLSGALMAAEKAGSISLRRAQKDSMRLLMGVYAQVLWDDDFVPMAFSPKATEDGERVDHGVSYGQTNMYATYQSGRDFFALLFRNDTAFKKQYNGIVNRSRNLLYEVINEWGASAASPHYTEPLLESLTLLLLQLKQQGTNFFETEPRVKLFARFYLHLLTPPSVRFAGNRKLISFGDGSEESAALFGLLSTGFRSAKPEFRQLAYDLDQAYRNGPMRDLPKAGIMALVYDYSADYSGLKFSTLKSQCFPGYLSHFRTAASTPGETALWLLNGNFYSDHRNDDDGELSLYALRAPLSLSRSSLYAPQASAPTVRSMVMPFADFPGWNRNSQFINYNGQFKRTWKTSELKAYAALNQTGYTAVQMGQPGNGWKRELIFYSGNPDYPLIVLRDETDGREPQIWSMPFFSEGKIRLPDGGEVQTSAPGNCAVNEELPNAAVLKNGSTEWPLLKNWNRFSFTGQEWRNYDPQKNVNGIDWWLYSFNNNNTTASFTEWTNFYIPEAERQEFFKTHPYKFSKECLEKNPAIRYRETQQIIRFKGTGRFWNVILPFRKGAAPTQCDIQPSGANGFIITRTMAGSKEIIEIKPEGLTVSSAQKNSVCSWGPAAVNHGSATIGISGGVGEVVVEGGPRALITLPLNSGNRTVTLPAGNWKAPEPPAGLSVAVAGNKITLVTGTAKPGTIFMPENTVTLTLVKQ